MVESTSINQIQLSIDSSIIPRKRVISVMQQEMHASQKSMFLAYDRLAHTQIETQIQLQPVRNYIKFQYPEGYHQQLLSTSSSQVYRDPHFTIDLDKIQQFDSQQQVIVQRISHIFHKSFSPSLFPIRNSQKMEAVKSHQKIYPHFIYELGHFDAFTFQRLFITQQLNFLGKYQVIVNKDGKFEVQIVDDFVPVYKKNNTSIWQLNIQQPWQLIIAKLWAKKVGGYHKILQTKPFEFIQYFTPSNWKYLNLFKQGRNFLTNYYDKIGTTCRILLKTKLQCEVQRCGLLSGQIAYELVEFVQYKQKNKQEFYLLIKSTSYHSWAGSLSIFDSQFKPVFQKLKNNFKLQTNFLMNQADFFNIFSSAYLSPSKKTFPEYINFVSLASEQGRPFCVTFNLEKSGFFLFNLVQSGRNLQYFNNYQLRNNPYISRLSYNIQKNFSQIQHFEKYLNVKFLLSKQTQKSNQNQSFKHNIAFNSIRATKLSQMNLLQKYHLCDFEYQKGYNKGDSHPLMLQPGQYHLLIYPQNVLNEVYFVFQSISHQPVELIPLKLNTSQCLGLLKESLKSIVHQVPCQPLENEHNGFISFGNEFNNIGFGFVGVVFYKRPSGRLSISVDLTKLSKEGYSLVDEVQQRQKMFNIVLSGGQFYIFVLSKVQDGRKSNQFIWPTTCFKYVLF